MYGLMRAGLCSSDRERARHRRLHYCGTCKSIGRLYGQTARLLLNNDTVFLAELLTALSPQAAGPADWSRAYQSFNCLALPRQENDIPLALQISAAATLVMSEFKVADQIDDGGGGKWKLAQRVYSQRFCDASRQMKAWGFPLERMWERYREQGQREAQAGDAAARRGALQTLEFVAEPTAAVTGWTFEHAAAAVGAGEAAAAVMAGLGFSFGRLVYVLDALDDYAQDVKRGDFNALQTAFELRAGAAIAGSAAGAVLPDSVRVTAHAYLRELGEEVVKALHALPMPASEARLLAARLRTNLARRLGAEPGCGQPAVPRAARLLRALRSMFRLPTARPAFALSSGGHPPPIDHSGIPSSQSPGRRRVRRPPCDWECCCCDCCAQIGCSCACDACCDAGCCCAEGGCAEGCGSAGCDGCCTACDCGSCG